MPNRLTRTDNGSLCTLTLDRPEKLNALDTQTFEELDAQLASLEAAAEQIGCVILRGAGRGFCSGADIEALGRTTVASSLKPGVIERLGRLPQPVIAAVHGVCYTGGLELALACDFIVADMTACFADTHAKWGLISAWGMTQRLPRRIGVQTAKRMMMTARPIGAMEAKDIGLIDVLAPADQLETIVAAFAQDILANSWFTNFVNKRNLRETDGMPLVDGLLYEQKNFSGHASDHAERLARFTKR